MKSQQRMPNISCKKKPQNPLLYQFYWVVTARAVLELWALWQANNFVVL
jgi:hypothetical protein